MIQPKKIIIISNTAWYIFNFRLSLMKALRERGHVLVVYAPPDEYVTRIQDEGFSFVPITMNRRGKNPVEDISLTFRLWRLFAKEGPDIILTYTPKPNIYASIAARFLGIAVINNVTGLGHVFNRRSILSFLVALMYRFAFSSSQKVFFQNNEDLKLFTERGLVNKMIAEWIPGSGVDLGKFSPQVPKDKNGQFVFLLVARMLWDKGVGEFVEAARLLKKKFNQVECHLVGFIDMQNPRGISSQQIQSWVDEGVIRYNGASDNIVDVLADADCVVLPSFYREGVPKSLLEAASMAKPIITTDSIGCRDAVEDGVTGNLCKVKDHDDLYRKMEQMLMLPKQEREMMGVRGREKMIREFDERLVIDRYIDSVENRKSID